MSTTQRFAANLPVRAPPAGLAGHLPEPSPVLGPAATAQALWGPSSNLRGLRGLLLLPVPSEDLGLRGHGQPARCPGGRG